MTNSCQKTIKLQLVLKNFTPSPMHLNQEAENMSIPPFGVFFLLFEHLSSCSITQVIFIVGTNSYHMTVTRHDFSGTLPSQQWILFMFISQTNSHCCLNQSTKEHPHDLRTFFSSQGCKLSLKKCVYMYIYIYIKNHQPHSAVMFYV